MQKSTFRVRLCEAQPVLLAGFACISHNLTSRQRTSLINKFLIQAYHKPVTGRISL